MSEWSATVETIREGTDLRGSTLRNSGLLLSSSMVKMKEGFRHEIHTRKIGARTGRELASVLVLS